MLEDTAGSSMAGQFDSVIGISGFEEFVAAVRAVLDSRAHAGVVGSPIAVLVQPLIEPRYGGVLFGIDPVSGRTDRRVVSAVEGGPEPLVSGEVAGSRYRPRHARKGRSTSTAAMVPSSRRAICGGSWSCRRPSPTRSAVRRTSSGRSPPTGTSGSSSPVR